MLERPEPEQAYKQEQPVAMQQPVQAVPLGQPASVLRLVWEREQR
ncbi:hypothetical protein GCM10011383_07000 [Hymenobacter cavernae]|uniref:Uncharacterized protein n=1 Tax=Hymenobacter cavernae TaxID=2044852 RepID=A0ABQ1TLX4_9BACT|nr:hypothetical protein GCM10011383_07000 [Hymenobacter cavernae]